MKNALPVILVVDGDRREREERAPLAVKERSMGALGCISAFSPSEAILQLQNAAGLKIAGVLSGLNFSNSGWQKLPELDAVCRRLGIPFLICFSLKSDTVLSSHMKVLKANGIKWLCASEGPKNWYEAVGAIMIRP